MGFLDEGVVECAIKLFYNGNNLKNSEKLKARKINLTIRVARGNFRFTTVAFGWRTIFFLARERVFVFPVY